MSIFGSIRDAIFGRRAEAAPPPQAGTAGIVEGAVAQVQTQHAAVQAAAQATAAQAPQQAVDVEAVLQQKMTDKGSPDLNWRTSIVDLMKLLDLDSSLDNRKELATELGYNGAKDGSAEMNIWLHRRVMTELGKSGGIVPASMRD